MTQHSTSKPIIKQSTQREALARTDARSDHAVLDLLVLLHQGKRTTKL